MGRSHRRKEGATAGTINHGLEVVRRIPNLAANEWMDEHGLTWLVSAPRIKLLSDTDKRKPYPLSREEEGRLFAALPSHLVDMALFAANTGYRDGEICSLWWEWAVEVPQVRVHDLKHTFGRRLRSAGVSFEDRQDLLGHRPAQITTHYSAVELSRLLEAANSPRLDPLCRLTAAPAEYSSGGSGKDATCSGRAITPTRRAGTAHRQVPNTGHQHGVHAPRDTTYFVNRTHPMSDERSHPLKLRRAVQATAEQPAHADGVSLDRFLATAIDEKAGSLDTVDRFLRQRAGGYEPASWHDVPSALPDIDPIEEEEPWPLAGEHRTW